MTPLVVVFALPRPRAETVPEAANNVGVSICEGTPEQVVEQRTVTSAVRIAARASAVNGLPVDSGGTQTCAVDLGRLFFLRFDYTNGTTRTVADDPGCHVATLGPGPWPLLAGDLSAALGDGIGVGPEHAGRAHRPALGWLTGRGGKSGAGLRQSTGRTARHLTRGIGVRSPRGGDPPAPIAAGEFQPAIHAGGDTSGPRNLPNGWVVLSR